MHNITDMRSQKQTNKAPRPHKSQSAARSWSGGPAGFIPPPKFANKVKRFSVPREAAPENEAQSRVTLARPAGGEASE